MLRPVLPTPNNPERARLVGGLHDIGLFAHMGRSVAMGNGAGAFGSPSRVTPSGYEKGHAAWDIGLILTRHSITRGSVCARVIELRRSVLTQLRPAERLQSALRVPCTCGAGDSEAERTSIRTTNDKENNKTEHPAPRTPPFRL